MVSKIIILLISVTLTLAVWIQSYTASAHAPVINVVEPITKLQSKLKNIVQQQYSTPDSVVIESIGVSANIETVGVDSTGAMETPHNFSNIGWLKTSSKLGENGNLVLSGHYDTTTGAPAVFYNLTSLNKGDSVKVLTRLSNGGLVTKTYYVEKVYLADPSNKDHIKEAYSSTDVPSLTLITCNGIWNPIKGEYSHRVVVKALLVPKV